MKRSFLFLILILCFFANNVYSQTLQSQNAEKFIVYLNSKDYDGAITMFDSTMSQLMAKEQLQKLWLQTIETYGSYKGIVQKNQQVYGKYKIVELLLDYSTKFLTARVVFDDKERIAGFYLIPKKDDTDFKTPKYADHSAFKEESLQFGLKGWELPASLAIPNEGSNFPIVIIINGSGPQDRDATMNKSKPLRDIAWGLASQGVATFRFEKRTKKHADKLPAIYNEFTVEHEYIQDVNAAIEYIKSRKELNSSQIYLLGHSQGGNLLPRIAKSRNDIAGLIFMAAPVRKLEDLLIYQTEYIMNLNGAMSEEEKATLAELKEQATNVKNAKIDTPAEKFPLNIPASYWIDLNAYSPISDLKKVNARMLVMQGGRDYQVTETDYNMWKVAMKEKAEYKWYPELNHIFAKGEGKITPQEYLLEQFVSKSVVDDIGNWVLKK